MVYAVGQRRAFEGDETLITLGVAALVDREREVPSAEPSRHRLSFGTHARIFGNPRRVELRVPAQSAITGHVGNQKRHRAVALGLESEHAVILECAGKPGRQCQCFA